jgi:hypothetical protein
LPSTVTLEQQVDGHASGEVTVDHERLRYVTRLLADQPGLNTALLGTFLFLEEILDLVSGWWTLLAGLAMLVGFKSYLAASKRWIPEYYQRRFGSVQAARKPWSKWDALFFLAFLMLLLVWIFLGQPIAHYLDPVASRLHKLISDPGREINLWPSLLWAVLFCGSLRGHMSSIERQRLYFMLLGMIGFGSVASYAIWHPEAKQLGLWKILNAGGLGLSLIAMGLYDHIVLVRALPKRVAEGDDE